MESVSVNAIRFILFIYWIIAIKLNNFTHLTGVLYTRNHCLYQSVMDLQIVVRVGATIVLEVVLVEGCKELKEDGGGGGQNF